MGLTRKFIQRNAYPKVEMAHSKQKQIDPEKRLYRKIFGMLKAFSKHLKTKNVNIRLIRIYIEKFS